jgi:hypothetical protein
MNEELAKIRAEIAYHNLRVKEIAAKMGMRPNLLSMRLHSVRPTSSEFLRTLHDTIQKMKDQGV